MPEKERECLRDEVGAGGGGVGEMWTDGQTSIGLERSPVMCFCFCDPLGVSSEQKDGNYLLKVYYPGGPPRM